MIKEEDIKIGNKIRNRYNNRISEIVEVEQIENNTVCVWILDSDGNRFSVFKEYLTTFSMFEITPKIRRDKI